MDHGRTILQDPKLRSRIAQAPRLLFGLDFDGTLAPIVDCPNKAVMPAATREVLWKLHRLPGVTVSIVSGRSLNDITSRVGIDGLIYSGNHGLEIEGSGLRFAHPRALALTGALRSIMEEVAVKTSSLDGVEIEWKQLTASVHYRRASVFARRDVLGILRASRLADDSRFVVREGKKVYDVRPQVFWNKADAMRWIRDRKNLHNALVILAGDDSTDEDAFNAFDDAISLCVAPQGQTAATHTLASVEELRDFLASVADLSARRLTA
jgi:trehalose 6-phosphate phosphatase